MDGWPQRVLDDVVGRVRETLTTAFAEHLSDDGEHGTASAGTPATSRSLSDGVAAIASANGQSHVLRALLGAAHGLGARAALFVVRDGVVTGWNGSGFDDDPELEGGVTGTRLDASHPSVAAALDELSPVTTEPGGDAPVPDFGQSIRGKAVLAPLRVRGHVAALLYADGTDPESEIDIAGISLLVTVCALAIERGAPTALVAERTAQTRQEPADDSSGEMHEPAAASIDTSHPLAAGDEDDPEAADARRFARLLMDEICLYHSDRVEEARRENDMMVRLADEIDKARRMYRERVATGIRAKGDFFEEAIVAVLCAGARDALGAPQATQS